MVGLYSLLTDRSIPHAGAEKKDEKEVATDSFVYFLMYGSIEGSLCEGRESSQEESDGEEGGTLWEVSGRYFGENRMQDLFEA
jgi:hypothetical protein